MFKKYEGFLLLYVVSFNSKDCCKPVFHEYDEVVYKNLRNYVALFKKFSKSRAVNVGIGPAKMRYTSMSEAFSIVFKSGVHSGCILSV